MWSMVMMVPSMIFQGTVALGQVVYGRTREHMCLEALGMRCTNPFPVVPYCFW